LGGEKGIERGREDWRRKWEKGNWREIEGRFRASGLVAGILGSGARESNFLELGSREALFLAGWEETVSGRQFQESIQQALSTSIFSRTTFFFKR
jgi:hypothetical protein